MQKSRSVALLFQVIMLCSRYRHTFCPFPACYCYRVNCRRVNKLFMRLAAPPLECVARLSLLDVVLPFPFSCFYESANPTGVIFGSNISIMPGCVKQHRDSILGRQSRTDIHLNLFKSRSDPTEKLLRMIANMKSIRIHCQLAKQESAGFESDALAPKNWP